MEDWQRKRRMCSRADEAINHIVSECPKLAQEEYKRRHDWIGRRIHWKICGANVIHVKLKWYEYQLEAVIEITRANHFITARRPNYH